MTREDAWTPVESSDTVLDTGILKTILDEIYGSHYQFLSDSSLARVEDANAYYDYYNLVGQYWAPTTALGYDPTILCINLARWFVDKRSAWMFDNAPDVECHAKVIDPVEDMEKLDYEPSDKQKKLDAQASSREQMLYSVWGENTFEEKMVAGGTDYFVGGTTGLKIRYLPYKGIKLEFAPTQECFPIPSQDVPGEFDKIHFCSFLDNPDTIWKQTWEMIDGRCYLTEGTYASTNLKPINVRYNRQDTLLDFLPVILFPNEALSGNMFGVSYLRDLVPLFDQYNRVMSDAADSLRFNLFAITVLLNAPPDAEKTLKVAPNELWNIGGDQVDAKKLESGFNYANALSDFLTRVENVMHLIGNVPDITPDRIKGFGLVSGVALKLLYADLVSATYRSWRIWKSRLQLTNEYILRMLETYKGTEGFVYDFKISDIKQTYDNRIIPHLPLPENEVEAISMEINKLTNSLQSVKGAMQNLGEKHPERKIAEIISERMDFMQEGEGMGRKLSEEEKNRMSGM